VEVVGGSEELAKNVGENAAADINSQVRASNLRS